ncbi:hypothetical protein KY361_02485 [Candidatus Woesearchaeota archaeon]|nr:hypothetical protein [Candidatus Woesearchaeota archaeon]
MKRRVIKQGHNTLTITLPRGWCDKFNVKAGEELDLIEREASLIIGEHKDTRELKISVDVSNLDRSTILILIQGLYRFGFDVIEITSTKAAVPHYRTGKSKNLSNLIYNAANRLVGAEVVSTSPKRYMIKRLAEESMEDFPTALKRIFFLLNEMTDTFVDSSKNNNIEELKSIEFQHANIKKFINFCLRLLNKFGHEDSKKTCFYFNIISLLSKTEDLIKNNSRYMIRHNIMLKSKKCFELLKDIKEHIRMYYELFFSYKIEKIAELNKHRDIFREKLFKSSKDLSKEENLVIGGLSQIIELILDMTETRMALEG